MYDAFLSFFSANEYKIKHGNKGFVRKEWIDYTERKLGFPLPESYKWWVREFGYFKVHYEYIKTIAPPEFRDEADSDILYSYMRDIENGLPQNELTILEADEGDYLYYFLIEPGLEGNEYRVCCRDYISEDNDFYADNFLKFLEMKIHEM